MFHLGTIASIMFCRAGTKVRRFHTEDVIVPETVGHHTCNASLIAICITRGEVSKPLLMALLMHDLAEQKTGDIPAPAKWESEALREALHNLEDTLDLPHHGLSVNEQILLKFCDYADLGFKAMYEESLGNRTAAGIRDNIVGALYKLPLESHPYRKPMNDVRSYIRAAQI